MQHYHQNIYALAINLVYQLGNPVMVYIDLKPKKNYELLEVF